MVIGFQLFRSRSNYEEWGILKRDVAIPPRLLDEALAFIARQVSRESLFDRYLVWIAPRSVRFYSDGSDRF